jgi:hypothetical protein
MPANLAVIIPEDGTEDWVIGDRHHGGRLKKECCTGHRAGIALGRDLQSLKSGPGCAGSTFDGLTYQATPGKSGSWPSVET